MPLVRISKSSYKKIRLIQSKTGWKSIGYTLDKLLENINSEDFFSYKSEVFIKVKKESD